jgi:pilus assembly protein CpaF
MKSEVQIKKAFGPLYKLVNDDKIFELVVDAFDEVFYFERGGVMKKAPKIFKTVKEYETFVDNFIKTLSGKPAELSYYFSLSQTLKVNLVLPPLSVKAPTLNIMKIPDQDISLDDLIRFEALDEKGKKIIQDILGNHESVLVAGNMGSGKTTLLNTLIKSLPEPYRVVTVERYPDLNVKRTLCARLQTQTQKPEELLDLLRIAERMRPDCLVLSECSGPEVMPYLDFLRSNSSGLALITAQNAVDALKRLETKALLSSEGMSLEDVRYAIAQALNVVIFQEKLPNGKRKVTNISRIEYDSGELKLNVLYK